MAKKDSGGADSIVIKKYANRRLYNTAKSSYVTLDDLAKMVRLGEEFAVFDAKSGEDITRSVLTQIIVEEEAKDLRAYRSEFFGRVSQILGQRAGIERRPVAEFAPVSTRIPPGNNP